MHSVNEDFCHPSRIVVPLLSAADVLMLTVFSEGARCEHIVPVDSGKEVDSESEHFQTSCLIPRSCV